MATPFERVKLAWESSDREDKLNRVVETMAAEGVARDQLDAALARLLLQARGAGADDEAEEIINGVGDRLHGWCHENGHIKTRIAAVAPLNSANEHAAPTDNSTPTDAHPPQ